LSIPVIQFKGTVYRAHHPKWAFDPLSGEGAKRYGGRFNRPQTSTLYTSLDLTTAWMEAQQGFPFKAQPMTLVAYEVDCANIADLNNPEILKTLGLTSVELACAWEDLATQKQDPPTWRLADQLQASGVNGIKCRSFASGCSEQNQNLILWEWSDAKPNLIHVIDDFERLPKSIESWNRN